MITSLSINKKYKFLFVYSTIIILSIFYIYNENKNINKLIKEEKIKGIIMHYNFYKKIYKTYPKLKNILIENSDYIDKNDLINEFSKSTPLMMEKEKIDTHKFNLTFKFFDKSNINDSYIEKKIVSLEDNEYLQGFEKKSIYLFGKIYNDGYVLIVKQLQQNSQILSIIENLFIKIFFVGFINIFLLLYLFNLIKNQESTKEQLFREFEQLQLDTKKVAFEDTLTGAATRLKFDETLKDLVNIASRFKEQKFTAIMIDIDNFKKVNDIFGHLAGDKVLREIALIVQKNMRKGDIFARYGGEEFIAILPETGKKKAMELAERLRIKVSNKMIEYDNNKIKVTASFGVARLNHNCTNMNILIKNADSMLYKAKVKGRNLVMPCLMKIVPPAAALPEEKHAMMIV